MIRSAFCLIAAMIGIAVAEPSKAAGPFGSIHVGNWSGGGYTDDKSGVFSHCAASTGYSNGTALTLGQNVGGAWLMGFGNNAFSFSVGETVPIDVTFDGQSQYHLFGTAPAPKFVVALLPNNATIDQLRKAHLMVAVMKGSAFQFLLNSTAQLLPTIANCVAKIKSNGLGNVGDFSIAAAKLPATNPVVQSIVAVKPEAPPKETKMTQVTGTGFVISAAGHVLTNDHVIGNCVGDIHGNFTGETQSTLRIVSRDEINDLAFCREMLAGIYSAYSPNFFRSLDWKAAPPSQGEEFL
jgi:S1-C subfamily serine protease